MGEAVPLPMRVFVKLPKDLPANTDPAVVGAGQSGSRDRMRAEPTRYQDATIRR